MGNLESITPSRVSLLFPTKIESTFVHSILPSLVSALRAVVVIFLLILAGIDLICFSDITPTPGGILLFFLGLFLFFKREHRKRQIYCVAWVNTPPLGAQYLSRYPVRLRRGRASFLITSAINMPYKVAPFRDGETGLWSRDMRFCVYLGEYPAYGVA